MGLKDEYDFDSLINDAEDIVLRELEEQIGRSPGICTCQDCVLDMVAVALNSVKPAYRVSLMGSVFSRAASDPAYVRHVGVAVKQAIQKVQSNKSHD